MDPTDALETIRLIARRYGYDNHAEYVEKSLARGASDPQVIWESINTNDMWGGSGSLADISLSASGLLPEMQLRVDELAWRNAFISLNAGMLAHGISNSRAQSWARAFQAWNDARIGI